MRIYENLEQGGFQGDVHLVNPNRSSLFEQTCYPSMTEVPVTVDLAVVVLRHERVVGVVEQCAASGVGGVIVISEGFGEVVARNVGGVERESQLRELVEKRGIALCGPNCLGFINVYGHVRPWSGEVYTDDRLPPGNVAVIAQSGGGCGNFIRALMRRGMGASYVVSAGNQTGMDVSDYADYLLDDPRTRVIACYLEGFNDLSKFRDVAERALDANKPLIVVKAGRSTKGAESVRAHTGALVDDDRIIDALFRKAGVLRARDIEDAVDKCSLFSQLPAARWPKSKRIGAVVRGGGSAALLCDLGDEYGIEFPEVSGSALEELTKITYETMTVKNPTDFVGTALDQHPEMLGAYLEHFSTSEEFGAILFLQDRPWQIVEALDEMEEHARRHEKCYVASAVLSEYVGADALERRAEIPVAIVMGLDRALRAISAAATYVQCRTRFVAAKRRRPSRSLPEKAKEDVRRLLRDSPSDTPLSLARSLGVLKSYNIPFVESRLVKTLKDALKAAAEIDYPVALKTADPNILHKADIGGVALNVQTADELVGAWERVNTALQESRSSPGRSDMVVQAMAGDAVEMYIGASAANRDCPVVTVGFGGTLIELADDISVRALPTNDEEARDMIGELRSFKLLEGYRGQAVRDSDALTRAIVSVGELAHDLRDVIRELDLNPCFVLKKGQGIVAADVLIVLQKH